MLRSLKSFTLWTGMLVLPQGRESRQFYLELMRAARPEEVMSCQHCNTNNILLFLNLFQNKQLKKSLALTNIAFSFSNNICKIIP